MEPTENLSGSDFQKLIEHRFESYLENGVADINKYGVQAIFDRSPITGEIRWQPIRSLPDYEGVLAGGRHIVFDAKAESGSSFSISECRWKGISSDTKAYQLKHMIDRSEVGGLCAFLLHFNGRKMKRVIDLPQTWLFPVSSKMRFWMDFLSGEGRKCITRADCERLAVRVVWNRMGLERKYWPDVVLAFQDLAPIIDEMRRS